MDAKGPDPSSDAGLPVRVGRYRVLQRLAAGSTSDVLLAKAEDLERTVVLKILLHDGETGLQRASFASAAADYARLSHPAIVKLHEYFSVGDQHVMVLEYVDGVPMHRLRAMTKRSKFVDDTAAMYAGCRLFEALAAAHGSLDPQRGRAAPVVHGEINPSNLLVPWNGQLKVAGFGRVDVGDVGQRLQAGLLNATYGYAAPEQARGLPATPAADVYSACVLLWEWLSGRKAIVRQGGSEHDVLRAIAEPSFPSLASLRPELPLEILDAVGLGLERDFARRTITAKDLALALNGAIDLEEGRQRLSDALSAVRPVEVSARPAPVDPEATSKVVPDMSADATLRSVPAVSDDAPIPAPRLPPPRLPPRPSPAQRPLAQPPRAATVLGWPAPPVPPAPLPPPAASATAPAAEAPSKTASRPASGEPPVRSSAPPVAPTPLGPPVILRTPVPPPAGPVSPATVAGGFVVSPFAPTVRVTTPPAAAAPVLAAPGAGSPSSTPPPPSVAPASRASERPAAKRSGVGAWFALGGVSLAVAAVAWWAAKGQPRAYVPPESTEVPAKSALSSSARPTESWHEVGSASGFTPLVPSASAVMASETPSADAASASSAGSGAAIVSETMPTPATTTTSSTTSPTPSAPPPPSPPPALAPNMGTITVAESRAGHRVWVDKLLVGESPGSFPVRCGVRALQVGSQGTVHNVTVPCGGDLLIR